MGEGKKGGLKKTVSENKSGGSALKAAIPDAKRLIHKKIKSSIIIVAVIIVAAVVLGVFLRYKGVRIVIGGGMTPQSIREISELATLEYRYRDVIAITEEEEFKLFGIWDIDPGEHILIVQYDGIMKLGIDCSEIDFLEHDPVEGEKTKIEIKLPKTKLLSSETPMDSFEVLVDRGVYTKTRVEAQAYFEEAAIRQAQYNTDVLSGELAVTARENAKAQLEAIMNSFSEIRDNYEIIWVD